MEGLERFLMEDEVEGLDIWPENVMINNIDYISSNLDDSFWDIDFIEKGGLDSEIILSFLEENEFSMQHELPVCFMNNEEEQNFLPYQSSQLEKQPPPPQPQQEDEELEEEVAVESDNKKRNEVNSRNLVSERNRRNRLNKQLLSLRSIVPNITKMDKQSILVDALAYLQSILQQIEREMEKSDLSTESSSCKDSGSSLEAGKALPIQTEAHYDRCAALPAISEMEIEMLEKERFLMKIGCNKAMGTLGEVHRMLEMLGLEITCISINENNQESMQIMAFLHVKKKGIVTQETLLHRARLNAMQLGLLPSDS